MASLSIRHKFAALFGALSLLIITGLVSVQINGQSFDEEINGISEREIPVLNYAHELKLSVVQVQQWLTDISATRAQDGLNDGFDEAQASADEFYRLINELKTLDPEQRSTYEEMVPLFRKYHQAGRQMAQAYIDQGPAGGNGQMSQFDQTAAELGDKIDNYVAIIKQRSADSLEGHANGMAMQKQVLLGGFIFLLVAFLVGYFVLVRKLLSRIDQLRHTVTSIEQTSCLDDRIPVTGSDELDELGVSFNALMDRIQHVLATLITATAQVGVDSARQSSLIESTVTGVQQQNVEIDMVATAVTEMSASIQEVTQNTNSAAEAADKSSQEALEGSRIVEEVISSIGNLGIKMDAMVKTIRELEQDSQNIGSVLEVINGIAEQTNLLALNAAIEAARAGEQGRGFAVVADEVRGLASRTQESTNEIRSMIERLNNQVNEVVTTTEAGQVEVENTTSKVAESGTALKHIVDSVTTINDMMTQIAAATLEQSQVAEEINLSIVNVSKVANHTAGVADKTLLASNSISNKVEELRGAVTTFKITDQRLSLEQAKAAHLAWRGRVRNYLDGHGGLSLAQATSHFECAFGEWYYSTGKANLGSILEFQQIEPPHAAMHQAVKQAIEAFDRGNKQAAEEAYQQIEPCSNEVVENIDKLLAQI
ncbi:MAG TPA: HAMP domain-containing protein [Ectothiorhodospiraceae bacterium]|nr:HAMP domain-containing protein [Ectothiorhodospiraceae bacterium]